MAKAMKQGLIARKRGMTQVFAQDGNIVPVTVLEAGPCTVVQVKTQASDGYDALQLGFEAKRKKVRKPMAGHFKKAGVGAVRVLREVRLESVDGYQVGQTLSVDLFKPGELVDVTGLRKGRGFQGGIKRHGWTRRRGQPRLDVPPGARLDRRVVGPLARLSRAPAAGAHGTGPGDDPASRGDPRAARAAPARDQGRRPGRDGRAPDGAEEREALEGAAARCEEGVSAAMAGTVTVNVVDASGKARGTLDLDATVFGAPIHGALLHQAVVRELNGRRAGTHDTKGRSEVSGGGKKPWKQKGTGRARQGSIRATQWKGGGKPFGPTPRSYAQAMPRRARRGGAPGGLGGQGRRGQLTVVERLELAQPKSKALVGRLAGLGITGTRTLLMVVEPSAALVRASQNVPWLTLGRPGHVSVAELLRHDRVVAERQALVVTQEGLLA